MFTRHLLVAAGALPPGSNTLTLSIDLLPDPGYTDKTVTYVHSIDNWTPQITTPISSNGMTFTYPGLPSTWTPDSTGFGNQLAIGNVGGTTYVTGKARTAQQGVVRMTYRAPGYTSWVVHRRIPPP